MRKQYANRTTKLQNNTRTIKIHTEMPLAHICTRGIPIIYYQRKIYLLLIVLLIISSLSHLVVLSFCLQLPSPKASALQPTRHSRLALTNLSGSQGTVTLAHSFGAMNLSLWFVKYLMLLFRLGCMIKIPHGHYVLPVRDNSHSLFILPYFFLIPRSP